MKITLKELKSLVRTEVRKKHLRENLNPARTVTNLKELRSLIRESVRSILKENESIDSRFEELEAMIKKDDLAFDNASYKLKLANIIVDYLIKEFEDNMKEAGDDKEAQGIVNSRDPMGERGLLTTILRGDKQNQGHVLANLIDLNNQLKYFPYLSWENYEAFKENKNARLFGDDIPIYIPYIKQAIKDKKDMIEKKFNIILNENAK